MNLATSRESCYHVCGFMPARRRKTTEPAPAPAPFTVGESAETTPEERSSLIDETVDGLLDLRAHLEQRVPAGLLWPLQKLPSMSQHLSDLESAGDAVDKLAVRHAMSSDKLRELRAWLLADAYAFAFLPCRHRLIVPEVHMAMCYASAGQAGKLAWLITQSGFEGYVIDQFRAACAARAIDPRTIDGVYQLDRALDWQNQRWPRGWYKTSTITQACTVLEATADPDSTILVVCAKEDKAFQIVEQSGRVLKSGIYNDLYPERVPLNARDISKSEIRVAGRTVSSREQTIQGTSYITREIGGHYSTIRTTDIVIRDVRGGIIGGGEGGPAIRWLHGMRGMRIMGRRWRRIHEGTINDIEDDDHAWMTYGRRKGLVMSVVVPAETYEDGFPESVFTRGKPTVPTFFPAEAILEALDECVASETEVDGVEAFRSDFWLAPSPHKTRLFGEEIVNDPDRVWMGPYKHPKANVRDAKINYAARFLVARIERNAEGVPLHHETKKPLDTSSDAWRPLARVITYDPFEDMDRVIALDSTWREGGRTWAASVAAIDPERVKFQFETRSGDGGIDEWVPMLVAMNTLYEPRVVGIDAKAYSDPIIQNRMKTDKALNKLRGKIVPVDKSDTLQEARIRAGVAGPLKSYGWLLLPIASDAANDFGAALTRRMMLRYRAGSDQSWPVLESLAMIDSLARKVMTKEQRERMKASQIQAQARYQRSLGPFGIPNVA